MPLFHCTNCGCVENTAVGNFWSCRTAPQCSECKTGMWHGKFVKQSAVGYQLDTDGFLWGPDEQVPSHIKIVGTITETQ